MSDTRREELLAELDDLLLANVQYEADFMKIRELPRVQEILVELRTVDSVYAKTIDGAIAKAQADYLHRRVRSKRGPDGERLFRYAEQIELPLPGQKPEAPQERRPIYAALGTILRKPVLRREILHRDRMHLSGYVKGMGEMDKPERDSLREYIETFLDRTIAKIAQLAFSFDEVTKADDAPKGIDKTGEEAGVDIDHVVNE